MAVYFESVNTPTSRLNLKSRCPRLRAVAFGWAGLLTSVSFAPPMRLVQKLGLISPQTPTTISLRHEEGKEDVILRKDIKEMYITQLSAMPSDLDKQIDVQQMADLLAYLKTAQ